MALRALRRHRDPDHHRGQLRAGLIGQWFGVEYASGFFHEFAGWVVYIFAFACLILVYGLIQLARGASRRQSA